MSASRSNSGERVRAVCFTENLSDGRTIVVPVTWYPGFWTLPGNNELAGKRADRAMRVIGRTSTKI